MPSVAEITKALGAEFAGDGALMVTCPAEPAVAGPDDLALAMDKRFAETLSQGQARAALLWPGADWRDLGLTAAIFAPRSRLALAGIGDIFEIPLAIPKGIHPTAVIDKTAQISPDCAIGPFTVVGPGARIGAGCRIVSHGAIGAGVVLGEAALLHPHVTIGANVTIGARFIAGAGSVVGGDGFAFVTGETSAVEEAKATGQLTLGRDSHHRRINSLGVVVIGDDVEIGSNTTIDRGTISETRIGAGTKLDNQVQIGHNVKMGRDCLMAGQSGVAGSTEIGDRVVIGGATAIADHLRIGSDVVIAGGSGVSSHIAPGKVMMGNPAVEMKQNIEIYKALRRLPRLLAQLRHAEKPVSKD